MRGTPRRLIPLLALLLAIPSFVSAQTAATRGFAVITDDADSRPVEVRLYRKMAAVVIGIDRYANAQNNLKYAVRDAEGIRDTLTTQYGFDPVYTLFDEEATRDNILALLLTQLPKETTEEDAVLVFFSGHGDTVQTPTGPLGYLVPHDGAFQQGQRNISMSVLRDDVSRALPSRHVCFIVDACYGGLLTTKAGAIPTDRNMDWIRANVEKRARQVLTAGGEDEQVLDGGRDGYAVYTGRVIEALREATDYITASELATSVGEDVFSDAQARGHKQTPAIGYLSGTGDFVFVPSRQSLAQLQSETARLEAALSVIERNREAASRRNDTAREAEEATRQAEMAEQLRQARQEERLAQQRQVRAAEAEAAEQQAAEQRREEERQLLAERARAAELRRKLEQQQAADDADSADMTLSEAVTRLSDLRKRIAEVEEQVRADVAQEKDLVRPALIQKVAPKDQFEKTAAFTARKRRIEESNTSDRARYQQDISAVDARLPDRLDGATSGFKTAIKALLSRERPVASDRIAADLGDYDADVEAFPYEITLSGIRSPLTGTLEIPVDAARELYAADQAGAMLVSVSGYVLEDRSIRLGDPSFGAPNLPKVYPGRSGLPTALPGAPNRPTGSPEADRLLQELSGQNVSDSRRRDIGVHLSKMGDPRPGVGVENGVPDIEWVHVSPGGNVDVKGTPKSVAPFYLAKYPVTYVQYEAFVKASDGFNNATWWRGMPSQYTSRNEDLNTQSNRLANAPRTDVSWYQAVAFTRWLSARMKGQGASVSSGGLGVNGGTWEVRLPTEWEWQWAAQGGSEQRAYPWGSWQAGHTNAGGVLKSTTAVGMYPPGAAASGALDMSGNVWEWCLNKWYSPYSTTVDNTNVFRVLRGGSFYLNRGVASSSIRFNYLPHHAVLNFGFRVGLFPPL